jgi:phage recombination protein Bet
MSSAIVKQGEVVQLSQPFFSDEQERLILDSFLNGAPKQEAMVLLEMAKMRKLNPFTRQIHFVKRPTKRGEKWVDVWAAQVGIDGFRAIAERTGLYAGQDEPEYEENKDGSIRLCRVKVYRKDWEWPAVGVAYWDEYVQTTREGKQNSMWARGKHFMLAKCAEGLALRKAFPEDLGGLYTPEELAADEVHEVTPKPTAKEAVRAKLEQIQPKKELPVEAEIVDPPHDEETGELQAAQEPDEVDLTAVVVPGGKLKDKPVSELTPKSARWYLENGPYRDVQFLAACEKRASEQQ